MATATIDAEQALTPAGFAQLLRHTLEEEITVFPARSWWPSQAGHPCDRYLVWRWTKWQQAARHDFTLQAIFDEGHLHAPSVYARLEQMGFDIVRESDRPTQYRAGGAVISGRPDGKIRRWRTTRYQPARILEIKTTQGWTFERLESIEDIRHASEHYVRAYADQGYLYAFLENTPSGVIVLKAKNTGLLKAIPFELDYGRAEELLSRVERLQGLVDRAEDPPPIPYDASICGRCPFLQLCYPPRDFGPGVHLYDAPDLVEDLRTRERLRPARDEYEELDRVIKTRLKRDGLTTGAAVAGEFLIEARPTPVKGYTVKERVDVRYAITRTATEDPAVVAALTGLNAYQKRLEAGETLTPDEQVTAREAMAILARSASADGRRASLLGEALL